METEQVKTCTKCKMIKKFTDFPLDKRRSLGFASACNECHSILTKKWYENNKKRHREYCRLWVIKNKKSYDASQKKRREKPENKYKKTIRDCKSRKLSFEITYETFLDFLSKPCYYCSSLVKGYGSNLDRIDNNKGYQIDNVLPCCGICNKIRNNFLTVEEMKIAMIAVIQYRKNKEGTSLP